MAWYDFPLIGGFGTYPDPAGNYPKPDINIIVPSGTKFTAPASGTVTSVDMSSYFSPSVTIQFDNPPNDVAKYYALNFLQSISVRPGQHINAGDIVGYGGGGSNNAGINTTAFAFSAGPSYGKGTGWTQNVVGQWINPKLNPDDFINSLRSGASPTLSSSFTGITVPGLQFPSLYQILGVSSQPDLVSFFQRYMIVSVGLAVVVVGLLVLFFSSEAGKKTLQSGSELAAA